MPIDYSKYPSNWQEIRRNILCRAENRCETCGLKNHITGFRDKNGIFHEAEGGKVFMIVLTVAHLNHDTNDNRPENLRALCQKCHLDYDKEHHRATRWKKRTKNIPELGI